MQRLASLACQPENSYMRKIVPLVFLVLFAASCSKESAETGYGKGQLLRILTGSVVQTEFSYDAKERIAKTVSYNFNGVLQSEAIYHYSGDQLVKLEKAFNVSSTMSGVQMDRSYSEMSYDANGRLTETKTYRISGSNTIYASRSVPEYDTKGRTTAVTIYDTTGKASFKTTYVYNADDNVIKEDFYQYNAPIQGPSTHKEYEYDQFKNPYYGKWVMPYGSNKNNIVKIIGTSYLTAPGISGGASTTIIQHKQYNADGYPTLVNEGGVDYVYEYK